MHFGFEELKFLRDRSSGQVNCTPENSGALKEICSSLINEILFVNTYSKGEKQRNKNNHANFKESLDISYQQFLFFPVLRTYL